MLSFTNLSVSYADRKIFESLSIQLQSGELTCLTGPNGSGKSTLLHLIARQCQESHLDYTLLYQQDTQDLMESNSSSPGVLRARELFTRLRQLRPAGTLLLDEPTNHLDAQAFHQFSSVLLACGYYTLIATHDRRLLRLADRIYHLESGRLSAYGGSYGLYQKQRAREQLSLQLAQQRVQRTCKQAQRQLQKNKERQQKRSQNASRKNKYQKNPKALINYQKNRADHNEARIQKQSNQKKLALQNTRDQLNERPKSQRNSLRLPLPSQKTKGSSIVSASRINFRFGKHWLWSKPISYTIDTQSKTGIVGFNGSGKSCLLQSFGGFLHPTNGEIISSCKKPFLISQKRTLGCQNETVRDFFFRSFDSKSIQVFSKFINDAGLNFSAAKLPIAKLSGGEKIRLELQRAFWHRADLLLLDEPTNDLDARARDMLAESLKQLSIPWLCVSHDVDFLQEAGATELIDLNML